MTREWCGIAGARELVIFWLPDVTQRAFESSEINPVDGPEFD
jgi:hypothetical protein